MIIMKMIARAETVIMYGRILCGDFAVRWYSFCFGGYVCV